MQAQTVARKTIVASGSAPPLVTLQGLTLTGGDVSGDGGAVNSQARLVIIDSVFEDNAASRGGAIYIEVAGGGATAGFSKNGRPYILRPGGPGAQFVELFFRNRTRFCFSMEFFRKGTSALSRLKSRVHEYFKTRSEFKFCSFRPAKHAKKREIGISFRNRLLEGSPRFTSCCAWSYGKPSLRSAFRDISRVSRAQKCKSRVEAILPEEAPIF
jgi:hypothetical protein